MHTEASSIPADHLDTAAIRARAYTIPTDTPEADGTFEWNSTSIVLAEIEAVGATEIGCPYRDACVATLIRHTLADAQVGDAAFTASDQSR